MIAILKAVKDLHIKSIILARKNLLEKFEKAIEKLKYLCSQQAHIFSIATTLEKNRLVIAIIQTQLSRCRRMSHKKRIICYRVKDFRFQNLGLLCKLVKTSRSHYRSLRSLSWRRKRLIWSLKSLRIKLKGWIFTMTTRNLN